MKRIDTTLTEQQIAKLEKLTKKTGITRAEHIRRALDQYFKKGGKSK